MGVIDQIVSSHLERLYDAIDEVQQGDESDTDVYEILETWSLAEGWLEYVIEGGE